MRRAYIAMEALEKGDIANPDEKRMVGHYWLRTPELAPTRTIQKEIEDTVAAVKEFAGAVHAGSIAGAGGAFQNVLVIGIGGSALGPQFVARALGQAKTDRLQPWFFDNTDPDGIDRTLERLKEQLGETLCVVTSKSGGTPETRNGMMLVAHAYNRAGLKFPPHAVAITMPGSKMDRMAAEQTWLDRFSMFDWIGGRTSVLSAVGLLPAALQGSIR